MKKIVIASDSFKGSASSIEIADSGEKAIHKVFPKCEVQKFAIADGGEGTINALIPTIGGELITCSAHDPLMNHIPATYGILKDKETAIIEVASASGLTLVPENKRDPMETTTYGTGELIDDALRRGYKKFIIGLGGSATNDAGMGMLQALGFRFFNKKGTELGVGGKELLNIYSMDSSSVRPELFEATFTIAYDVNNPFCGKNGAARIYAPQKGANPRSTEILEQGLRHFSKFIKQHMHKDITNIPGAGAAGGLGGCFLAFLSAELKSGIEAILAALHFDEQIKGADLIITGEGKLDKQTGMGKAPLGILHSAQKQNIPVIAIGGSVDGAEYLNQAGFLSALSIQPKAVPLQQAMKREFTLKNIEETIIQVLRIIQYYHGRNV